MPTKPKGPHKRTLQARAIAADIFFGEKDKALAALAALFKEKKYDKYLTHWEKIGAMFMPAMAAVQVDTQTEHKVTIEASLAQLSALVPTPKSPMDTVPIEEAEVAESIFSSPSTAESPDANHSAPSVSSAPPKKKSKPKTKK